MFRVPRSAGGHPRLIACSIAIIALTAGAIGLVRSGRFEAPAPDTAVAATRPARPPLVVVENLPQLSERLAREGAAGRFSGAVLVARGDEVLFRQTYGKANHEQDQPLELDSRFRLASVSKQFTAAAILRLQDEGVLTVEDAVCRWIQPCPAAWEPIRLKHLLSHTSGIPDLMARPAWGLRRVTPATSAELTAESAIYGLQFEPGTKIRYNNAAYNLLGAVVEQASGKPFGQYLQDAFFTPLGMKDSGVGDAYDKPLVMGYANFPGGLTPQPQANVSIVFAAGAVYASLDDLLVWNRALHGGRLLSPTSYAQMIADHAPPDTPDERGRPRRDWGYGLFSNTLGKRVNQPFGDRQIYHTGSWAGFRHLVTYQPDQDVTVIVLSNNYHQTAQVFLISQQAMAEALGRPFPTARSR